MTPDHLTYDQLLILLSPIAFCVFVTLLAICSPSGYDR